MSLAGSKELVPRQERGSRGGESVAYERAASEPCKPGKPFGANLVQAAIPFASKCGAGDTSEVLVESFRGETC